jgi:ABC-type nickel/cobalt efflux system permease component RcnA
MMTGAILVLAHSMLYAVYKFTGTNDDPQTWLMWYSFALAALGGAFMVWGFVRDIGAERWRRHHRHKGDT